VTLREQKMAERRERILVAAREIIAEDGLEALTTRALASRAQVTVPTVYNLVGAKDAVLFAAVEDQTRRFLAAFGNRAELRPEMRAIAVSRDCVAELIRAPHYYRAILLLMHSSEAGTEVRRSVGQTVVAQFEEAVTALQSTGNLVDWIEPRSLAERLGVTLTAAALQWATGDLAAAELERTAALGTCLLLLGACRGSARSAVETEARQYESRRSKRRRSSQTKAPA
jgi:AcrR family transcriptional regulator